MKTTDYKAGSERTDEAERLLVPPFKKTPRASAPELLEACKAALHWTSQLTPMVRQQITDAIAKAEGGAS